MGDRMKIKLIVRDSESEKIFDISNLASDIQYETDLAGQPGKLTFILQEDPKELADDSRLQISNGSRVFLTIDDYGVFAGNVFTIGISETGEREITAYDHMRYLKYEHSTVAPEATVSQLFEKLCTDFQLKHRVDAPSELLLEPEYYSKKTLYDILDSAIEKANMSQNSDWYFIKDDFGTLVFTSLSKCKTDLILGEKSLLTEYQYEISIDNDTYNQILVTQEDEDKGSLDKWIEFDSSTQKKWGVLQKVVTADENYNEAQLRDMASQYLNFHNRESRTMKLTAIGVAKEGVTTGRIEKVELASHLSAGSGFRLELSRLGIMRDAWINSITHTFERDMHTMEMSVSIQ